MVFSIINLSALLLFVAVYQPCKSSIARQFYAGLEECSVDAIGALGEHNTLRIKHNSSPVSWSKVLSASAKAEADKIALESDCAQNFPNGFGVNYLTTFKSAEIEEVIRRWYDEGVESWDFWNADAIRRTGDPFAFTQVVWRSTEEVGCGRACCEDSSVWVCKYVPAGNMPGYVADNVGAAQAHEELRMNRWSL